MRKQLFLAIVICIAALTPLTSIAQEKPDTVMKASDVSFFVEGRKVGLKNANSEVVCDAIFDAALGFDDNGLSIVRAGKSYGFLRLDGTYTLYTTDVCNIIYPAEKDAEGNTIPYTFKKGNGFGIMSRSGEIILEATWDAFYGFSMPNSGVLSDGERYYHVDYAGNIMPEGGADAINMLDDGRFELIIDDQLFGYDKEAILYARYQCSTYNTEDHLSSYDKDSIIYMRLQSLVKQSRSLTNAYIDGEEIGSDFLEDFFPLGNGLFAVKQEGKWGVIDSDQNMMIDFQWDDIYQAQRNPSVFGVGLGDKHGWITHEGEIVLPIQYDQRLAPNPIRWLDDNRWTALHADGRFDIVDAQGNIIATFGAEYRYGFIDEKYIRFTHDESQTWGYINGNGEVTNAVSWDWAASGDTMLRNGYILVSNADARQYGFLGAEGGLFVTKDVESEWLWGRNDALRFVEVDGGFALLNKEGEVDENIIWEDILLP